MNFNNTWKALAEPGQATEYFDALAGRQFQPSAQEYSSINAWWLMEFCRLVYRQEADELGKKATRPTRNEVLTAVGMREERFFNVKASQCYIVRSGEDSEEPYAALVFRGSSGALDWVYNGDFWKVPWPQGGKIHRGFRTALDHMWEAVEAALERIDLPIFYAGHSLGGAMAVLAASRRPPVATYTFGCPRVGNEAFAEAHSHLPFYRTVNNRDLVTRVPPLAKILGFKHFGEVHYVTHDNRTVVNMPAEDVRADRRKKDPALRDTTDFRKWYYPNQALTDHTPQNYVAHLERFTLAEAEAELQG